jgi:hypothetical protein
MLFLTLLTPTQTQKKWDSVVRITKANQGCSKTYCKLLAEIQKATRRNLLQLTISNIIQDIL